MLEKLWRFLLGDRWASSASGLLGGAAMGAATTAVATKSVEPEVLVIGALGGAISAVTGSAGRVAGEKR